MLPGGLDPKSLDKMMKQMGIKSTELNSEKVVIELKTGGRLVIFEPQIIEIEMEGQKSYQISGHVVEEKEADEDDIKLVMESAGCSKEEAMNALRETKGDIAEAILMLRGE